MTCAGSVEGSTEWLPASTMLVMADMLCPIVVGRSADLEVLAGAVDAASRGAGSAVLVTGEAGVGKSRLLCEVRGWCTERGGTTLVGRATDTAMPIPLRPLAEALLAAYRAASIDHAV